MRTAELAILATVAAAFVVAPSGIFLTNHVYLFPKPHFEIGAFASFLKDALMSTSNLIFKVPEPFEGASLDISI